MTAPLQAEPRIAGVLLAAGSGKRFGGPKALADTGSGPWVLRALDTLAALTPRVVVIGAAADEVRALLPAGVRAIENPSHDTGMGSSLAAALAALRHEVDAAVVMLVDLPDVPEAAVERVTRAAIGAATKAAGAAEATKAADAAEATEEADPAAAQHKLRNLLARASYHGVPGHPVLIGAAHFAGVVQAAHGDHGARDYLKDRAAAGSVIQIDCTDLGTGDDQDERRRAR